MKITGSLRGSSKSGGGCMGDNKKGGLWEIKIS